MTHVGCAEVPLVLHAHGAEHCAVWRCAVRFGLEGGVNVVTVNKPFKVYIRFEKVQVAHAVDHVLERHRMHDSQ